MNAARRCVILGAIAAFASAGLPLTAQTPPVQGVDKTPDCGQLHHEILEYYRGLPTSFRMSNAEADRLALATNDVLLKAKSYLTRCAKSVDPAVVGEVEFVAAKATYLLSKRYRTQVFAELKDTLQGKELRAELLRRVRDYLGQVDLLAERAIAKLPRTHELRPRAMEIAALSVHEAERPVDAAAKYRRFLREHPGDERAHAMVNGLARAFLDAESFDDGIALLERALRDHYRSASYPYFVDALRRMYGGAGKIDEYRKIVRTGLIVFPLKQKNTRLSAHLRNVFERFEVFFGYWNGYGALAAGDFDGAQKAFEKHIAAVNALEKAYESKGRAIKPEYGIYRARSELALKFVTELSGRPAPRELDAAWITDKKLTIGESLGSVAGILFRGVNDERSQEFMSRLSHVCSAEPDLAMAAIHYLREQQPLPLRERILREEIDSIDFVGAAGFDPDDENQEIFRAYSAKVGSATFVVVDRTGNLVWHMEDPRGVDVGLVTAIMKRVGEN